MDCNSPGKKKKKAGSRTGSVCPWEGGVKRKGAHTSGSAGTDQWESEGASAAGRRAQPRAELREARTGQHSRCTSQPQSPPGLGGEKPEHHGHRGPSGPVKGEGGESQHPYSWRTPAGQRHSNPTVTREGLSDAPVVSCGLVLQNGSADSRLAW